MRSNIPPINRLPGHLDRLSSMRASTRVGMVFVGSNIKSPLIQDKTFAPRIIMPDHQAQRERAAWRHAIACKDEQLRMLRDNATCPEEKTFWTQALWRLHGAWW